ncbi:hypothetical protein AALC17_12610, partial [Oscillospiraceae bacterium 38-13]
EFGEEHFKDLRLEHDKYDPAHDEFGRPSNEWSYKKVTIGTFPLPADFTYTTQVAHVEETDGAKEKALGLRNYDLIADGGYSYWNGNANPWWDSNNRPSIYNDGFTTLWLNGLEKDEYFKTKDGSDSSKYAHKVADIADFTDNGTLVEVYVSYVDADWITDVVVIQTQLMEVDKVASDYIALKQQDPDIEKSATPTDRLDGKPYVGYNQAAIDVEIEDVKDNNEECYATLKDLKAGDEVAVVPVTTDGGKTYDAAEVYVPETVSGTWTRVDTYGKLVDNVSKRSAISITVGGTEYKIADWNAKMYDQDETNIKATRKDVTLLMDKYGNAMKAKGIGDTSGFMVIGNYYQSIVNNKVCTFVHGWDISGTELDLNLGSNVKFQQHGATIGYGHELGELVTYTSKGVTGDADYALTHDDVDSVFPYLQDGVVVHVDGQGKIDLPADNGNVGNTPNFEVKTNNLRLPVSNSAAITYSGTTPSSEWPSANDNVAPRDDAHFSNPDVILADIKAKLDGANIPDSDLYTRYTFADNVKFIYVNYTNGEDEVDSVEFKSGRQNATFSELTSKLPGNFLFSAQASVDGDKITSVVIKRESSDASLNRMLYVINYTGFNEYDRETGRTGIGVLAARFNADGSYVDEVEMIIDKNLAIGAFATYSDTGATTINGKEVEHYYHVKNFTRHNTNPAVLYSNSVAPVKLVDDVTGTGLSGKYSKYLLQLDLEFTKRIDEAGQPTGAVLIGDRGDDGTGAVEKDESYVLSDWRSHDIVDTKWQSGKGIIWANSAHIINGSDNKALDKIDDVEDMLDWMAGEDEKLGTSDDRTFKVTILFNESPSSDDFRVSYLIVLNDEYKAGSNGTVTPPVEGNGTVDFGGANLGETMDSMIVNGVAQPFDKKLEKDDRITFNVKDGYEIKSAGSGLTPVPGEPNTFIVNDPKGDLSVEIVEKVVEPTEDKITYTLKKVNKTTSVEIEAAEVIEVLKSELPKTMDAPVVRGYYSEQKTYTVTAADDGKTITIQYVADENPTIEEIKTEGSDKLTGNNADAEKAQLVAAEPGVYELATHPGTSGPLAIAAGTRAKDVRYFKYNTVHTKGVAATYTFKIDDGAAWTETTKHEQNNTVETGSPYVFFVQVQNPIAGNTWANSAAGKGTLATSAGAFKPGSTHTYTIDVTMNGQTKTIQSGSFTMPEAEGDVVSVDAPAPTVTVPEGGFTSENRTAAENAIVAEIKALGTGVYVAPDVCSKRDKENEKDYATNSSLSIGNAAPEDCRFFVFDAGETSGNVTITITDEDGTSKWTETMNNKSGPQYFFAQVTMKNSIDLTTGEKHFYNSGSGSMTSTALSSGTYTWTITKGTGVDAEILVSGTFSV